ncbi:MAG TPA: MBL fold metallo-hydrolase [Gemmatimonadaceae bacterium]
MRLWTLGSGSKGNAIVVECGDTRILVDAGFGTRTLAVRLAAAGIAPASIEAVIVTHEHSDHVRGAAAAAAKWGWTLHASAGTIAHCPPLAEAGARPFRAGETLEIGAISLESMRTPHDAAESVALVATARETGARAGIATDMGHVDGRVAERLMQLDLLVLESNHDELMLQNGPYPFPVRKRIAGPRGHLSNVAAGELARRCAHGELRHLVLAHLSENCNEPAVAVRAMRGALARTRFRGALHAAPQHAVAGPFAPRADRCVPEGQLSLF